MTGGSAPIPEDDTLIGNSYDISVVQKIFFPPSVLISYEKADAESINVGSSLFDCIIIKDIFNILKYY